MGLPGSLLWATWKHLGQFNSEHPWHSGSTTEPADLRPWTLTHKVASATVPHLAHLADAKRAREKSSGEDTAAHAGEPMRKSWKAYTRHM